MAFSVTTRGVDDNGTADSQTQTLTGFTPSANSLVLFVGAAQINTGAADMVTEVPTCSGYTFTKRAVVEGEDAGQLGYPQLGGFYSTTAGGSPAATGTITWDPYSGSTGTAWMSVGALDITGHDAADPYVKSVIARSQGAGSNSHSQSVTFGSGVAIGNLVLFFVGVAADSGGGFAAPTIGGQAMTQVHNVNNAYNQHLVYYRVITGAETNYSTGPTITCSDVGDTCYETIAVAIEIRAASGGGTVNGTALGSWGALTGTASGVPTTFGTAAGSWGALTGAANGVPTTFGTAAGSWGGLTGTANGARLQTGTALGAWGSLVGAASGTPTTFGTAAGTWGALTGTATGTRTTSGTAAGTWGTLTGTASSLRTVIGTAAGSWGALTGTANGQVSGGSVTVFGTALGSWGGLTGTATGVRATSGAAAGAWGALAGTATGLRTVAATAAGSWGSLTGTASGVRIWTGTATGSWGALTGTANGTPTTFGTAVGSWGGLVGASLGDEFDLVLTVISSAQIDLAWRARGGITHYDIERDGSVIQTGFLPSNTAAPTYSDTGLDASTQYAYRVRGVR